MLKIVILSLLVGCTQIATLNLKKFSYGKLPTKFIWLQVPGLSEEHISFLRFAKKNAVYKSIFEKANCIGKTWNYNMYSLRTSPEVGLFSQIVGKQNVAGSCQDFRHRPIWDFSYLSGFETGIFEVGGKNSWNLESSKTCNEGENFLERAVLWKMKVVDDDTKKFFHIYDKNIFLPGEVYYDSSCQKDICYTSVLRNLEFIFGKFRKSKTNYLFLFRYFSLYEALEEKNIKKIQSAMEELENILSYFHKISQESENTLFLVTSTSSRPIEFPKEGLEWKDYEEKGKNITYKNMSLLSPVFAFGARAENFCGIFEQSETLTRLLKGPRDSKLKYYKYGR